MYIYIHTYQSYRFNIVSLILSSIHHISGICWLWLSFDFYLKGVVLHTVLGTFFFPS